MQALLCLTLLLLLAGEVTNHQGPKYIELIDDFSTPYLNNIGGIRSGVSIYDSLTYPRQGISLPSINDYFIETLTLDHVNLTGKCLRIQFIPCTIKSFERPKIMFLQRTSHAAGNNFEVTSTIKMFSDSSNTIPLVEFAGADLTMAYGFAFIGPLVVKRLEFVDNSLGEPYQYRQMDSDEMAKNFLSLTFPFQRSLLDSRRQIQEITHKLHSKLPPNNLGLRRDGSRITKTSNGIQIGRNGFLYESLVKPGQELDLSGRSVQICYSSAKSTTIRLKFQYHSEHDMDESNYAFVTPPLELRAGSNTIKHVHLIDFPAIQLYKCKSIWVFGSLTVHRIELFTVKSFGIFKWPVDVLRIDDFTTWPTAPGPNAIKRRSTIAELLPSIQYSYGTNNLDLVCGGDNVMIQLPGIELFPETIIFEQVSSPDSAVDLTSAYVELEYYIDDEDNGKEVSRYLECVSVVPSKSGADYEEQRIKIGLKLSFHDSNSIVSVGQCGLTRALLITGDGGVTIHTIQLHFTSLPGQKWNETVLINDFTNWPLSNIKSELSMSHLKLDSVPDRDLTKRSAKFFDFRLGDSSNTPVLHRSWFILGQGIEVSESGYLLQAMQFSAGTSIKIRYTSQRSGICKLILFIKYKVNSSLGKIGEDLLYVHVEKGTNNKLSIPAPYHDIKPIEVVGVQIHGPLFVHDMRTIPNSRAVATFPKNCALDRLRILVDDFSDWQDSSINVINRGREYVGSIGSSYIQLSRPEDFLIEYFVGGFGSHYLQHLALRIVYTSQQDTTCHVSLIPDQFNAPKRTDTFVTRKVDFKAGSNTYFTLPILSTFFEDNSMLIGCPYYALRMGEPSSQLTLHRIELVINGDEIQKDHESSISGIDAYGQRVLATKLEVIQRAVKLDQIPRPLICVVRRKKMWKYASFIIGLLPPTFFRGQMLVWFIGESGLDSGGLTREFFSLMAKEIADPKRKLFISSEESNYALKINPDSARKVPLRHFRVVGRIIGMSIRHNSVLGITLAPHLVKYILTGMTVPKCSSKPPKIMKRADFEVDISDLKSADSGLYSSLHWYLGNDVTEVVEQTMTMEYIVAGRTKSVKLVENGDQVQVTESNKKQYVHEYADWHVNKLVQKQASHLRQGIYDVLPENVLSHLSVSEFERLVAGSSEIDVDDWKLNSQSYIHPTIDLFWQCVRSFDNQQRSHLLQFVTGSSRVPGIGFIGFEPRFTIDLKEDVSKLPTANTCDNELHLPMYKNVEDLTNKLVLAMQSGMGRFDLT